jgi:hypothetical protein
MFVLWRVFADRALLDLAVDVVDWMNHKAADKDTASWQYSCYVTRMERLFRAFRQGIDGFAAATASSAAPLAAAATRALRAEMCSILRMDPATVNLPAGGATSQYSSLRPKKPVYPVGVAMTDAPLAALADRVNNDKKVQELTGWNGLSGVRYPSRNSADVCDPAYKEAENCESIFNLMRTSPNKFLATPFITQRTQRSDDVGKTAFRVEEQADFETSVVVERILNAA